MNAILPQREEKNRAGHPRPARLETNLQQTLAISPSPVWAAPITFHRLLSLAGLLKNLETEAWGEPVAIVGKPIQSVRNPLEQVSFLCQKEYGASTDDLEAPVLGNLPSALLVNQELCAPLLRQNDSFCLFCIQTSLSFRSTVVG